MNARYGSSPEALFAETKQSTRPGHNTESVSTRRIRIWKPGDFIDGYELKSILGSGIQGTVWEAWESFSQRAVALKLLADQSASQSELWARFRDESRVLGKLDHPNIVRLYRAGEADGQAFIALEVVPGGSLEKRLAGHPQLTRPAVALLEKVAHAMHFAHQNGIIHRDLKPANILVREANVNLDQCTPKVSDFGMALLLDNTLRQTQDGRVLGTPIYMAPEQANGNSRHANHRADIYALGVILGEMLTGLVPSPDNHLTVLAGVPSSILTVCGRCMQKDPAMRYPTAEALANDLRCYLDSGPIEP
jgi:serine/threonine protein kinase